MTTMNNTNSLRSSPRKKRSSSSNDDNTSHGRGTTVFSTQFSTIVAIAVSCLVLCCTTVAVVALQGHNSAARNLQRLTSLSASSASSMSSSASPSIHSSVAWGVVTSTATLTATTTATTCGPSAASTTIEKESVSTSGGPAVLDRPTVEERVDNPVRERSREGGEEWEVRIYNDGMNTREHVARSLVQITGMTELSAYQTMMQAHQNGIAAVGRFCFEIAEMYNDGLRKQGIISDIVPVDDNDN